MTDRKTNPDELAAMLSELAKEHGYIVTQLNLTPEVSEMTVSHSYSASPVVVEQKMNGDIIRVARSRMEQVG